MDTTQQLKRLTEEADAAFKAWFKEPDNKDLEYRYRCASKAVQSFSQTRIRERFDNDDSSGLGEHD